MAPSVPVPLVYTAGDARYIPGEHVEGANPGTTGSISGYTLQMWHSEPLLLAASASLSLCGAGLDKMARISKISASALVLALACFRQAAAFVPAGTGPGIRTSGANMHRSLHHRIEQQSVLGRRRRSARRTSMLRRDGVSGGGEVGRNSYDASGNGGASTRLEFGVGMGAAAAAIVLGGTTTGPKRGLAEDAGVAEAAQGIAPEVAAPEAAAAAPAAAAAEAVPLRDMGIEVPYTGKSVPLSKFLGSRATLVVNPKIDDPESLHQVRCCLFSAPARGWVVASFCRSVWLHRR